MNEGPLDYQERRAMVMVVPVLVALMAYGAGQYLGMDGGVGWFWFGGIFWVVWALICRIGGPVVARLLTGVLTLITVVLVVVMIMASA